MSNSAAFYQILYQNETLFHLAEGKPALENSAPEPAPIISKAPKTEPVNEAPAPPVPVPKPAVPQAKENFPVLNHKILVLLDEPKHKEMIASEALFLDNILKAVGHSSEHVDILNFSFMPGQDARSVLSEKKTNFFITFGVPLIKLHLDLLLVPYTPKLVEGIWFLLTDALVVIEADRNLKKKLWQALQKMFEMS